jgi:hypothetical protein
MIEFGELSHDCPQVFDARTEILWYIKTVRMASNKTLQVLEGQDTHHHAK